MGAYNSCPQTAHIKPFVVTRLTKRGNQNQSELEQEMPRTWKQKEVIFQRKYKELEERMFNNSAEKLETTNGQFLTYKKEINKTIRKLELDLIKCYQNHPEQSLSVKL